MLPDQKGEKLMWKFRKCIKYDDISTGEGKYNAKHEKYVYTVKYPDGTMEQLKANIIDEKFYHKLTLKVTTIKCWLK